MNFCPVLVNSLHGVLTYEVENFLKEFDPFIFTESEGEGIKFS